MSVGVKMVTILHDVTLCHLLCIHCNTLSSKTYCDRTPGKNKAVLCRHLVASHIMARCVL